MATTGDDGAQLGVYMPDYYGNYRTVVGARPDTMGLTGKFLDELLGLYYFNARWYDPVRGRFASNDPLRIDAGINYYSYALNMPNVVVDIDGMCPIDCEKMLAACKATAKADYESAIRDINRRRGRDLVRISRCHNAVMTACSDIMKNESLPYTVRYWSKRACEEVERKNYSVQKQVFNRLWDTYFAATMFEYYEDVNSCYWKYHACKLGLRDEF